MSFEDRAYVVGEWVQAVIGDTLEFPDDLFASIQSGAVLCQLMNELMTDDIDFDPFPETVDGQRSNLELFCTACDQLGLSPVFQPDDLLDSDGDVRVVLDTLIALAQAAVDIGYEGPLLKLPDITTSLVEPEPPKETPKAAAKVAAKVAAPAKAPVATKAPPAKQIPPLKKQSPRPEQPKSPRSPRPVVEEPVAEPETRSRGETEFLLNAPSFAGGGASGAMEMENTRLKGQIERAQLATASQMKLKDEVTEKLKKERERVAALEKEVAELNSKASSASASQDIVKSLKAELEASKTLNGELEARVAELEGSLERAEQHGSDMQARSDEFETAFNQLQREFDEQDANSQQQIAKLEEDVLFLTGELNKMKEQMGTVKKLEEDLANAKSRAESLEAGKKVIPVITDKKALPNPGRVAGSPRGASPASAPRDEGTLESQIVGLLQGKPVTFAAQVFEDPQARTSLAKGLKAGLKSASVVPIALKVRAFDSVLVPAVTACLDALDVNDPGDLAVARAIIKVSCNVNGGPGRTLQKRIKDSQVWPSLSIWSSLFAKRNAKARNSDPSKILSEVMMIMVSWDLEESVLCEFVANHAEEVGLSDEDSIQLLDDVYGGHQRRPSMAPGPADSRAAVKKAAAKLPQVPAKKVAAPSNATKQQEEESDGGGGDNADIGDIVREGSLKFKKGARWVKASVIVSRTQLTVEYDDGGLQVDEVRLDESTRAIVGSEIAPSALKTYSFKVENDEITFHFIATKTHEVADWVGVINAVVHDEPIPEPHSPPPPASKSPQNLAANPVSPRIKSSTFESSKTLPNNMLPKTTVPTSVRSSVQVPSNGAVSGAVSGARPNLDGARPNLDGTTSDIMSGTKSAPAGILGRISSKMPSLPGRPSLKDKASEKAGDKIDFTEKSAPSRIQSQVVAPVSTRPPPAAKTVFEPTPGSVKEGDLKIHLNKKWLRCHMALTSDRVYLSYQDPATNDNVTIDVSVKSCKLAAQSNLAPAALRDSSWRLKDIEEVEYHFNSNAKKDAQEWMRVIMEVRDNM